MQYRRFGTTDWQVSEVGFGCARLGGIFGDVTKAGKLRTLHRAFDQGINFYDTADMYCQGESEKLLGEAFRRRRDKVIIASKVGYCLPGRRKLVAQIKPLVRPIVRRLGIKREHLPGSVRGALSQDFSPAYILQAAEQSLKRLKTDYLDLYQLHSPPRAVLESGEFLEALEKLQQQGKIRRYGISCETTEDALIALKYPGIASLQLRLNLLDQSVWEQVLPAASARGLGIIVRECYAGGLLARPLEELKLEEIIADPAERATRQQELVAYSEIAHNSQRSLRELALQFALHSEGVAVTLLGMTNEAHLSANLKHLSTPTLTDTELSQLRHQSALLSSLS